MKKLLIPFALLLLLMVSACSNASSEAGNDDSKENGEDKSGTITYESENGPVEVPADPQRVTSSFHPLRGMSWHSMSLLSESTPGLR